MSGGLTDKLRGSLEGYLARSAAELDERGAEHADRVAELEAAAAQLEEAERELDGGRAGSRSWGRCRQGSPERWRKC